MVASSSSRVRIFVMVEGCTAYCALLVAPVVFRSVARGCTALSCCCTAARCNASVVLQRACLQMKEYDCALHSQLAAVSDDEWATHGGQFNSVSRWPQKKEKATSIRLIHFRGREHTSASGNDESQYQGTMRELAAVRH